jgi:hypothetical protein
VTQAIDARRRAIDSVHGHTRRPARVVHREGDGGAVEGPGKVVDAFIDRAQPCTAVDTHNVVRF